MTLPDVETLRLCSVLNAFAFGAIYAVLWLGRRGETHLLYWAASSFLYCATLIGLAWIRDVGLLGGGALFALLAISNLLPIVGLRLLEGRAKLGRWMVLPIVFAGGGYIGTSLLISGDLLDGRFGEAGGALGLGAAMLTSGVAMLHGPMRGQRITGLAMLCYLPGFAVIMLAPFEAGLAVKLAVVPMLSDMLLLPILNLGLLAIPLERAQETLRDAALRDPLTGVWNRAGLAEQKMRLWGTAAGVIAIDVDNFKTVNDRFGHAAGDAVLIEIAREAGRIAAIHGGALARVGGDEFIMLLSPSAADPRRTAEALIASLRISQTAPLWSVSLGVAVVLAQETDFEGALRRADAALYQAKAGGRNRLAA